MAKSELGVHHLTNFTADPWLLHRESFKAGIFSDGPILILELYKLQSTEKCDLVVSTIDNLFSYLSKSDTYIRVVCGQVWLQQQIPTRHVFKRDWTTCSKNYSRLNSQHNWRDLYEHFMSTRIFNLIMHKIII